MRLRGKSVLITGSSRGIGLAIGKAMAAEGAQVVLTSETPLEMCEEVQELLTKYPDSTHYSQSDLTQDGAADELVNKACAKLGRDTVRLLNVTCPHPGRQAIYRVVGLRDQVFSVAKGNCGDYRTEYFLF